jgi:hypothetical protein
VVDGGNEVPVYLYSTYSVHVGSELGREYGVLQSLSAGYSRVGVPKYRDGSAVCWVSGVLGRV